MIRIGNKTVPGKVFLAPMAGITDVSYREIAVDMGCDLVYSEMVSAKALHYGSRNTESLLRISEKEKPIAVQLFGSEKEILARTAEVLSENEDILLFDINMGCPAPKIVKNGEGAALMREPSKAADIIRAVKKATQKPVTCKFRRGYHMDQETALDFAKRMEEAGADLVTVHGRFRDQFYSGASDWNIIRRIKEALSIPVIGNGDIFSGSDARRMLEETGVDGVMVARGALGNPWIFQEIKAVLEGRAYAPPTGPQVLDMVLHHYKQSLKHDGTHRAVREMRKHVAWYLKGLYQNSEIKARINEETDPERVFDLLENYRALLMEHMESR